MKFQLLILLAVVLFAVQAKEEMEMEDVLDADEDVEEEHPVVADYKKLMARLNSYKSASSAMDAEMARTTDLGKRSRIAGRQAKVEDRIRALSAQASSLKSKFPQFLAGL